jgi:hypothetical protein
VFVGLGVALVLGRRHVDDPLLDPLDHLGADFGFAVVDAQVLDGAADDFGFGFRFGMPFGAWNRVNHLQSVSCLSP